MTENHNIRKIEAFELDRTIYIRYVDKCNSNNFVWMKVDRADPETDLETYNLLEKLSVESKEYPSYCCPKCGEEIGWIGRFFQFLRVPLHRCKKPYKPKIVIDNSGASTWVNSAEYFLSDEGQEFIKRMREFAKRHIKK